METPPVRALIADCVPGKIYLVLRTLVMQVFSSSNTRKKALQTCLDEYCGSKYSLYLSIHKLRNTNKGLPKSIPFYYEVYILVSTAT
jgi:hypothetical protein